MYGSRIFVCCILRSYKFFRITVFERLKFSRDFRTTRYILVEYYYWIDITQEMNFDFICQFVLSIHKKKYKLIKWRIKYSFRPFNSGLYLNNFNTFITLLTALIWKLKTSQRKKLYQKLLSSFTVTKYIFNVM